MGTITSIIDTVLTPPLASLQQVLDTGGPYSAGDHPLENFSTGGAFLLPAGTYGVSGTYGVVVNTTTFPPAAGQLIGFNGIIGGQDKDENEYRDRIAQLVLYHQLPITGLFAPFQRFDVFHGVETFMWPVYLGSPAWLGLHVFPNFAVDLYYLCVL